MSQFWTMWPWQKEAGHIKGRGGKGMLAQSGDNSRPWEQPSQAPWLIKVSASQVGLNHRLGKGRKPWYLHRDHPLTFSALPEPFWQPLTCWQNVFNYRQTAWSHLITNQFVRMCVLGELWRQKYFPYFKMWGKTLLCIPSKLSYEISLWDKYLIKMHMPFLRETNSRRNSFVSVDVKCSVTVYTGIEEWRG